MNIIETALPGVLIKSVGNLEIDPTRPTRPRQCFDVSAAFAIRKEKKNMLFADIELWEEVQKICSSLKKHTIQKTAFIRSPVTLIRSKKPGHLDQ